MHEGGASDKTVRVGNVEVIKKKNRRGFNISTSLSLPSKHEVTDREKARRGALRSRCLSSRKESKESIKAEYPQEKVKHEVVPE